MTSRVRPVVGIACDESGFVGGSLFGGIRVFAHASLRVEPDEATTLVDEVRRRTGAGADELKASRLNRPWAHDVAAWLCGPDGPLAGRATVHVTDTRLFGLARLAQVCLLDDPPQGWWAADRDPGCWDLALALTEARGPSTASSTVHATCCGSPGRRGCVPSRRAGPSWPPRLARARDAGGAAAGGHVPRVASDTPLTEPLLPALAWALAHWSAWGNPDVAHDEQSVLTPARVEILGRVLAEQRPGRRLAGLVRVDSRLDDRVRLRGSRRRRRPPHGRGPRGRRAGVGHGGRPPAGRRVGAHSDLLNLAA